MATGEATLLKRCLDIELARDVVVSERVDRHEWGLALLSPSLNRVWDANCIVIERTGMPVGAIVDAADETIGAAGMDHRTVVIVDEDDGRRLAPEFEALGWESEPGVYMVLRRSRDREGEAPVAERRQAEIEGLRRELIRAELAVLGQEDETTIEQLLEWDRRVGEADGDRWFVAPAEGEPASACRLLARDGIGQVEDIGTLSERREQGLARAVTLAAARASQRDGSELTYLGALANDWPRLLYAKLGFDEVGCIQEFRRKPPSTARRRST
jgi:ribosomal protein S18 acetylase RimI-like enzyme